MPSVNLTELEIKSLLEERKALPADFQRRISRRVVRMGHERADMDIIGVSGRRYCIMVRQNEMNALDFSAILGYYLPKTTSIFRLRRYNGKHYHTNRIEGITFRDFHIHVATERYQRIGAREDTFAEVTDRFSTLPQALRCLLLDGHFEAPVDPNQPDLFGGGDGTG